MLRVHLNADGKGNVGVIGKRWFSTEPGGCSGAQSAGGGGFTARDGSAVGHSNRADLCLCVG